MNNTTLKMNGFEELAMDEMMAACGGARTRAQRTAAAKAASAARANLPTSAQVAKAATIGAGICMVGAGGCAVIGATLITAKIAGGATIAVGIATAGYGVTM